jgi:pyruvate,orthophosphate dikinase
VGKEAEVNMRDMQDIEFTIQEGELYILQTRDGKRTPLAALRVAVDLAEEKVITELEAVDRVRTIDLGPLVEQKVVAEHPALAKGTPASLGIVTGKIALSTEGAMSGAKEGPVILVRETLTPDDLSAVAASAGVITAHGNRMAHAIVVARQLDKACIVNVPGLSIDPQGRSLVLGGKRFHEGALLSMDSRTGEIFEGTVRVLDERPTGLLAKIEEWGGGPSRPPSP